MFLLVKVMATEVASCEICFCGLGHDPISGSAYVGAHVSTSCGHLLHEACWIQWAKVRGGMEFIM